MTFRHTLGTTKFRPGIFLCEGLNGGFIEVFAEQSNTGGILDVDEDTTPPVLVESYIVSTTGNEASSVTITLFFFNM
jgi:hypothetical protein